MGKPTEMSLKGKNRLRKIWVKPRLGAGVKYHKEYNLPHYVYLRWSKEVTFWLYRDHDFSMVPSPRNTKYANENGYKPEELLGRSMTVLSTDQIGRVPLFWWLNVEGCEGEHLPGVDY